MRACCILLRRAVVPMGREDLGNEGAPPESPSRWLPLEAVCLGPLWEDRRIGQGGAHPEICSCLPQGLPQGGQARGGWVVGMAEEQL